MNKKSGFYKVPDDYFDLVIAGNSFFWDGSRWAKSEKEGDFVDRFTAGQLQALRWKDALIPEEQSILISQMTFVMSAEAKILYVTIEGIDGESTTYSEEEVRQIIAQHFLAGK